MELVELPGDDVVDVFEVFVDFFGGDFSIDDVFLVAGLDSFGDVSSSALSFTHEGD